MQLSAHNIISKIKESDDYFIVNLLSQEADIISVGLYKQLKQGKFENEKEFIEKGYLVNPADELSKYRKRYLEFIDNREQDEVQLFFVPSYQCNFNCSYCYQDEYHNLNNTPDDKLLKSFFNFIEQNFSARKKYLTLFGGEPLLNGKRNREFIENFITEANHRKLDIAVVTNGYYLSEYIEILKKGSIREVQVTLDGVGEQHDKRRPLKGGGASFLKIAMGIDDALNAGFPINLRMVIDKENVKELPKLADYAIEKGWTSNPLFKTQLGRNYELHHCQYQSNKLYSRIGLYEDIYQLIKEFPQIMEFYRPSFSISKFLFEEGELPDPLFDSCPGTKTEWAFDYTGNIYSCTATVGKVGEELGTFSPEIKLYEEKIQEWESRDVLAIQECKNCNLQLACGGGCAAVAKNQKGSLLKPDCRPVKELLELGIATYFQQENS